MELRFISYQSSTIFYRVTGKGKPVILLHGFGEDGMIWENQISFFKDHFQLIIPDLPGSGKSSALTTQLVACLPDRQVGMEEYALMVKAILDKEQIAVCTMIGHSMGGYITLAFAEKFPHLLFSFGLLHSTAFADSEEKKSARLKSIEFIQKNGAYEFLKTSLPGLFFMGQDGLNPSNHYINGLIEKGKLFSSEALIQYYHAMIERPDRTEVLKKFEGPILFIMGEYDNAIPFSQSLQQCYLPDESQIHILRNSAHMGMLEEPAKINNSLLQFLQ